MVLTTLKENSEKAKNIILSAVPLIASEDWSDTLQQCKVHVII